MLYTFRKKVESDGAYRTVAIIILYIAHNNTKVSAVFEAHRRFMLLTLIPFNGDS